jgi:hypothetical protein
VPTSENEANWRRGFEMVGPETLRAQLATVLSNQSVEFKRCAEKWILEKDEEKTANEARLSRKILGWTIAGAIAAFVAAAAAIVSAWPVVFH